MSICLHASVGRTTKLTSPQWKEEQGENLIQLTITQPDLPAIKMITEAGIIGKIGLQVLVSASTPFAPEDSTRRDSLSTSACD